MRIEIEGREPEAEQVCKLSFRGCLTDESSKLLRAIVDSKEECRIVHVEPGKVVAVYQRELERNGFTVRFI